MTALLWGLWASALLVFLMAAEYGYRRTRKAAQRIVPDKLEGGSVRIGVPVVRVTDEQGADVTHYAATSFHQPISYATLDEMAALADGPEEDGV